MKPVSFFNGTGFLTVVTFTDPHCKEIVDNINTASTVWEQVQELTP